VPFPALVSRAARCDTLVQQYVVAYLGGFADHDAHAVVDK